MGLYQQLETPKNYSPILSKWILIRAQNNTLLVSGSNRVGCHGARRWLHKGHDSWASRAPCMILLALTLDACHEVLATPQTFTEIFTCTVLFLGHVLYWCCFPSFVGPCAHLRQHLLMVCSADKYIILKPCTNTTWSHESSTWLHPLQLTRASQPTFPAARESISTSPIF